MPTASLKAHFDGDRIQLDEPFDLPANAPLLVTILTSADAADDRIAWTAVGEQALARAYADGEPEYTVDDFRK